MVSKYNAAVPGLTVIPTEFGCGDRVTVGGDVQGVITAICLRGDVLTYEVAWWDHRIRRTEWLPATEIKSAGDRRPIGFVI